MRAEQVTGPVTYHGEGPVWSESWGGLRWVDMLAGDVLALSPPSDLAARAEPSSGWSGASYWRMPTEIGRAHV